MRQQVGDTSIRRGIMIRMNLFRVKSKWNEKGSNIVRRRLHDSNVLCSQSGTKEMHPS